MTASDKKTIEISKSKSVLAILLCCALVAIGCPILLSSGPLKIGFSDLQRIADEYFLKYGKRA